MDTYVKSCGESVLIEFIYLQDTVGDPSGLINVVPLTASFQLVTASSRTSSEWETDTWTICYWRKLVILTCSLRHWLINIQVYGTVLECSVFIQGSSSTSTSATSWVGTPNRCLRPWSWAKRWWRGWEACRASSTRSSGSSATPPSCTSGGKRPDTQIHNSNDYTFFDLKDWCCYQKSGLKQPYR